MVNDVIRSFPTLTETKVEMYVVPILWSLI